MRRGRRVIVIEFPYSDPEIEVYTVPEGIPVEIPERVSVPVEPEEKPERKENGSNWINNQLA